MTAFNPTEPETIEIRATDELLSLLERIQDSATRDLFGEAYTLSAVAVDNWLARALAVARELQAGARGDVLEPGGEHGGPAD